MQRDHIRLGAYTNSIALSYSMASDSQLPRKPTTAPMPYMTPFTVQNHPCPHGLPQVCSSKSLCTHRTIFHLWAGCIRHHHGGVLDLSMQIRERRNHYRSDPVRVQSIRQRITPTPYPCCSAFAEFIFSATYIINDLAVSVNTAPPFRPPSVATPRLRAY